MGENTTASNVCNVLSFDFCANRLINLFYHPGLGFVNGRSGLLILGR